MMRYQLVDYDVWGNPKDGFEVNQAFTTDTYIDIPKVVLQDDRKLVGHLRKHGLVRPGVHYTSLEIEGDPDYSLYFTDVRARSGGWKPAFELRRVR